MNPNGGRTRWAGRLSVPDRAHPLIRQLFQIMNREKACLRDVAAGAGVHFDTISDWRYRRNPYLPSFEAVLHRLGYELVIRPKRGE